MPDGANGSTILVGTTSNDTLIGGSGADTLTGDAGSDFLNGGSGSDALDGGSGADKVLGGSGSDTLIYRAWENLYNQVSYSAYDVYDGGSGAVKAGTTGTETDTLLVYLSNEQMADTTFMAAFEAEWAQYETFITNNLNRNTGQTSPAQFTFTTINLKVSAVENADYGLDPGSPVATDDSYSTNEDVAVPINLLANDTDGNSQPLTVTKIDGQAIAPGGSVAVTGGTVSMAADGSLTFTPSPDFSGPVSFSYTVSDGGLTDTGQVSITVTAVADIADDSDTTAEDTAVITDVLGNDSFEDPAAEVTSVTQGANGTVAINPDGTITYTPNPDFNGSDSYTYTVTSGTVTETATVNVTINAAVTAVNDKLVISSNTSATFSASVLTANDSTQLQVVSMAIVGAPQGTLTFNAATQTFTYTSTGGTGAAVDTLSYTLSNGAMGTVTLDVVNANSNTFNLTTENSGIYAAAGSYQGSYLDFANGNDTGTGSVAPDTLLGGAGTDTLNGGSGGDILRGGAGNDTLNGQGDVGQFDLIDLSDAAAAIAGANAFTLGAGGNGSYTSSAAAGLGTDTYTGIEGVIGSAFNDTLTGNAGNNEIRGGSGNDILSGLGGNDILKGDAGNDTMTGGAGNDTFVLGPTGVDTITDYSNVVGNADIIDVSQYLSVAAGTDVIGGQYLRVTTTGLVQVDADGGGTWVTIANVNLGPASYTVQYYAGGVLSSVSVTPSGPPVALDLDGDGQVSFLGTDAGATFDYGYGTVTTAWVAGNDGLLVRDANGDGQISANEIVFATSGSDLEGLAVYDTNHDGQLSAADAQFAEFGVWQDADSDGQVDAGELQSLAAHSIASISLASDGVGYSAAEGDVQVVGTGTFTRTDGSTGVLADSVFATGGQATANDPRLMSAAGSTGVMAAAVAAMGLAAAPAHAQAGDNGNDQAWHGEREQSLAANPHSDPADMSPELGTLQSDEATPSYAARAGNPHTTATPTGSDHSLTGSETAVRADAEPAMVQSADVVDSSSIPVVEAMVAMPSAELLAGAFEGAGANARGGVASVIADALAVNDHSAAIDALLQAVAPRHGPDGPVVDPGASLTHLAAAPWLEAPEYAQFTVHTLPAELALVHPDALPAS